MFRMLACAAGFCLMPVFSAAAQEAQPQTVPFEGGSFTIAENDDYEKVLTYDGREIARNYVLFHDRTVDVGDVKVALFTVGDGGNQCGTGTVIVWKKDGAIADQLVGEDCGAPPAAVAGDSIYFVPYLLPGETSPVQSWSPDEGLKTAGNLTFTPQPDTSWETFKPASIEYMVDAFDNAGIHDSARKLLGSKLTEVVTGLLTGGYAETQADGTVTGSGCVPHACGVSDTFMAIDPKTRKLYFAQQVDGPRPAVWPKIGEWPSGIKAAMAAAIMDGR